MTSHYTRGPVTTLHLIVEVTWDGLWSLLVGSHNFMVTALGSCMKWSEREMAKARQTARALWHGIRSSLSLPLLAFDRVVSALSLHTHSRMSKNQSKLVVGLLSIIDCHQNHASFMCGDSVEVVQPGLH